MTQDEQAFALWRWPGTQGKPICPKCASQKCYECIVQDRPRFRCGSCKSDFTLTSGTPLSNAKLPVKTLLSFISTIKANNGRRSVLQLSRDLSLSYKTVYVLMGKAAEALMPDIERKSAMVGYMSKKKHQRPSNTRSTISARLAADASTTSGRLSELISKPRFFGGYHLATRTNWSEQDGIDLGVLAQARVSAQAAADALGRSETSLAWYARDHIPTQDIPFEWKALITPKRPVLVRPAPLVLVYPYLPAVHCNAAASGAKLTMEVAAIVSRAYPDFMRADICQIVLLAILEGKVDLHELRQSPDAIRAFVRHYRREQDTLPGIGGARRNGRSSLDAPRWSDDDKDTYETALPAGVMNRLEW